jgi:succinoglycan biosynthesis transport protein ExoP
MADEERTKEIDLMEYWGKIVRRKWVAIAFAGTVVFLAVVFSFLARPLYRSTATLLIEEETSKILSIDAAFRDQTQVVNDLRSYNTQLQLLKSKALAERVARKLNLLSRPEFGAGKTKNKGLGAGLKYILTLKWLSSSGSLKDKPANPLPPANPYSAVAGGLLAGISVTPVRDTKIIELSYVGPYPALSTEIANTFAEEFISFSLEKRYSTTQQASDFLTDQIANLRDDLAAKERELQRYGQEKDIVFLTDTENTAVTTFANLDKAYNEAMLERINAEAEFRELSNLEGDSVPRYISDPAIQQLKIEYTRLKTDYDEKGKQLKADHPEMVRIKARLDSLKEEINKAADAAQAKLSAAQKKEASIKYTLDKQRGDLAKMKNSAILYNSIKSEVESKQRMLNTLLERQSETQLSAQLRGLNASNISIIDKAEIPESPVSPKKGRNLFLALFVGLFGGVGLCFLFDYLDDTLKSPEEVEKLAGLPSLGVSPYLPPEGAKKSRRYGSYLRHKYTYGTYGKGNPGTEHTLPEVKEIELVNHLYPDLPFSEDYRTVRTSVLLSQAEKPPRTLLFSSALTQEGKTSTVVNMAVSFAQLQERVIIVETDLRKPRLHRLFKLRNVGGLTGFLTGKVPLKEMIHKTFIENVWLIPSGPIPPNPAELLNSAKMKDMLEEVGQVFDIVLLDSPPVLAVIDSVIISSIVDGTVMVVRSGKTRRKPFVSAVEELRRARANIIGVVFNGADLRSEGSQYAHYYRYRDYGAEEREEQAAAEDRY